MFMYDKLKTAYVYRYLKLVIKHSITPLPSRLQDITRLVKRMYFLPIQQPTPFLLYPGELVIPCMLGIVCLRTTYILLIISTYLKLKKHDNTYDTALAELNTSLNLNET